VPKKFASLAAPFPLQADAFSCHDSPDFNRNSMQMTNSQALFEDSVNAQGPFSSCQVRQPLVLLGSAEGEENLLLQANRKASRSKTKISYKYQSVAARITFVSPKHHLCY
jgi:hypothetical protein